MVNVVLLTRNRHKLVAQAVDSLYRTTPEKDFSLVILDDGSDDFRAKRVLSFERKNYSLMEVRNSNHVLAKLKNIAIGYSRTRFGAGDYLLVCDNDVCFLPDWLPRMTEAISTSGRIILGGARHPFHQINKEWVGWDETDAVAGTSQMMPWKVWNHLRPLRGSAAGVCQSEDFEFCQRAIAEGWRCGYMHEPAILDCGITNSDGKPSPGADVKPRVDGIYYE
jgi:GT2 family glycosyltransferase